MFNEFAMILSIIIIHEMGHFLASLVFKWKLDKIAIYPFGGCVTFKEDLNRSLYEELIILIMGPLVQFLYFLLLLYLYKINIINIRDFNLIKSYHFTLLVFNLLPIYPLDGGKLLNIFTNLIFPFKKGNKIVIIISLITIFIILIFNKNTNLTLMLILLLGEVLIYVKRQDYLYNRLLLERYLKNISFKKLKVIKNSKKMYQNKRHLILDNNDYITERQYLKKRFRR